MTCSRLPTVCLTIVQSATWIVDFALTNDDRTPVDLTGFTAILTAEHIGTGIIWIIDSAGIGGLEMVDLLGGLFRIRVGSDVTANLSPGRWSYAIRLDKTGFFDDDVLFGGDLEVICIPGGGA